MKSFHLEHDADGEEVLPIALRGRALLRHNFFNRGTAFTLAERDALGLTGLLPWRVSTLAEQVARQYAYLSRYDDPLDKYLVLEETRARNVVLYYRLLLDHVEELMPVVYTPTVGRACQEFSHLFRRGRGIWITPDHRGRIAQVLEHAATDDIRLVVVTDNERILGLGDQGAGGMGIPVGKLALYTVAAGIHPSACLPVSLDVGTDNPALLGDPLYVGYPHPRLRGPAYDELLDEFVTALKARLPHVLLQWEDFKKGNAFRLLERYRDRLCSFNDDIQGTAAVTLAGVMAATRVTGTALSEQRIIILGGGAAGIGIARLLFDAMVLAGATGAEAHRRIAVVGSRGLLTSADAEAEPHRRGFGWEPELLLGAGLPTSRRASLLECVRALRPTVLIGVSGQPGAFDRPVIEEMARGCERPAIFPLSNPTANSEAAPADVLRWTGGRALVATGSPFEPVPWEGKLVRSAQSNNVYIFPGLGLGAIAAEARRVSDAMFAVAAETLAACVEASDLAGGALFPPLTRLREVSARIALAVARSAVRDQLAPAADDESLARRIAATMWEPRYPRVQAI